MLSRKSGPEPELRFPVVDNNTGLTPWSVPSKQPAASRVRPRAIVRKGADVAETILLLGSRFRSLTIANQRQRLPD